MASKAGRWVYAGGPCLVLACDPGAARVDLARVEAPRPVLSAAGRSSGGAGPDRGSGWVGTSVIVTDLGFAR